MKHRPTAVLDACVLVPAALRDTLLRLAEEPALYRPLWTDEIIRETMRALREQIGLAPAKTAYLERELRRHFPAAWVSGYEPLIARMTNDPKDRHVLAAAAHARANTIVTFNKRDFPIGSTAPWNVVVAGPSGFLEQLLAVSPEVVHARLEQQAADLGRSLDSQLKVLALAVPSFVGAVRQTR